MQRFLVGILVRLDDRRRGDEQQPPQRIAKSFRWRCIVGLFRDREMKL
jgi:hypothetical protein